MQGRANSKDLILDAAEAVVVELGAAHLTLDAVVHHAGVSKGGLLYHFPTKEALLKGMMDRLLERYDERKAQGIVRLGPGPGVALRAHLLAAFEHMREHRRVSAAILAAGANDPRLLDPIRKRVAEEVGRFIGDPRQVAKGLVILLATDGLWFNELLELMSLTTDLREAVMSELLRMAQEASNTGQPTV